MKNLFLGLCMLAGTAMFASNSMVTSEVTKEVKVERISISETINDDSFLCQWCVSAGANQYCAEAETCTEAKGLARAMYLDDLKQAPAQPTQQV